VSKKERVVLAYIVGVALGDGNLSNPNGRATRLRITCDAKYPRIAAEIIRNLRFLLPDNKVSIIRAPKHSTYFNISVYSNKLHKLIPWRVGKGTKLQQRIRVPKWIRKNKIFSKECLRGLIQTDGCIYKDRGYVMVNFTNSSEPLAQDVLSMIVALGFRPTYTMTTRGRSPKYTVRIARDSEKFIKTFHLFKE